MKKIVPDPPRFTVDPDLSFEDALAQICDLLRSAAVTAASSGNDHPMARATEHLINSAKALADRALDCLHTA
jgi:hypothetical protein